MELSEVRRLGEALLAEHGLDSWSFGLDNAKKRAGVCRYDRRVITVSRTLMALYAPAEVRDTILHEVAHALAGPEHGHDAVWRATAQRIGCSGRRLVAEDAPRAPAPWVGRCPAGHEVHRYRRPSAPLSCSRCAPTFDPAHLIRWALHGQEVPLPVARQPASRPPAGTWAGGRQAPATTDPLTAAGRLPVGTPVRVLVRGKYAGTTGTVVNVGRTRYHLRTRHGLLTVSFAGVEALRRRPAPSRG